MEQQVRILAAEGDLKMTCYVKETVIGGPAVSSVMCLTILVK